MDVRIYPVSVESYTGSEKILWDWTVQSDTGKVLTGMESSELSAKFYVTIAILRFMFTRLENDGIL